MARATYRRRSDGILEIVKPTAWQRLRPALRAPVAVLVFLSAAVSAAIVYVVAGAASLAVLACGAAAAVIWRRGKEKPVDTGHDAGPPPERRSAP